MNPIEREKYLHDHLNLYLADEIIAMWQRVEARMMPHLVEMAMQDMAEKFVKQFLEEENEESS